jgi:hypothetical protein
MGGWKDLMVDEKELSYVMQRSSFDSTEHSSDEVPSDRRNRQGFNGPRNAVVAGNEPRNRLAKENDHPQERSEQGNEGGKWDARPPNRNCEKSKRSEDRDQPGDD